MGEVRILVTLKDLKSGQLIKKVFAGEDDFDCYKKAEKWAKENDHDIFFFEVLKEPQGLSIGEN